MCLALTTTTTTPRSVANPAACPPRPVPAGVRWAASPGCQLGSYYSTNVEICSCCGNLGYTCTKIRKFFKTVKSFLLGVNLTTYIFIFISHYDYYYRHNAYACASTVHPATWRTMCVCLNVILAQNVSDGF